MRGAILLIAAALVLPADRASAETPADARGPVSREEYDKLLQEQQSMREEINALKADRGSAASKEAPATSADLDALREELDHYRPGFSTFHLAGDADVGFTAQRKTHSSFSAGAAPMILWEPTDRLLFEFGADFGISTDPDGNSTTDVSLRHANISYLLNDYVLVGGGLFVVPFAQYHNHFDPSWINKLPDDPLAFGDGGIAPSSQVGVFARGAVPIRSTKLTYDIYLTNGPNLVIKNADAAGSLNFDDFTDLNDNKAVGGRLGFLPIPNLEMGYSFQFADVAPSHFGRTYALLQAADLNYRQDVAALSGTLDFKAEWVWSDVDRATYDPTGTLGFGPIRFGNYRQGGYAQLAYRPTMVKNRILSSLEFVTRYDMLRTPLSAPGGDREQRLEFGIDYWLTPSAVLKFAYEIDDKKIGPDQNAFFVQFGIGF